MKILLDSCVGRSVKTALQKMGHDVVWVKEWIKDPGDRNILNFAFHEKRVLSTLDQDFLDLAIHYKEPHYGIIRLDGIPARRHALVCLNLVEHYQKVLEEGYIIIIDNTRKRIRI